MKILHIINNLTKGGAERLLVDVLPLYVRNKQNVTVLQLSESDSSNEYIELLREGEVMVYSFGSGSLYAPSLIFKLKFFIEKGNYDVVHVHLFPAMYWTSIAFKLMGKRRPILIFTEHSTQNKRLNNSFFRPIDRYIYKSYDSIVAISLAIQQKLEPWTSTPQKIMLIQNGVNIIRFNSASVYDRSFFLKEWTIPSDAVILFMAARFLYPKDHITVINALKELPEHVHLILAGEGEEKNKMEAYAAEIKLTERVHFLGFRTDIASLMKSVDVNILSSKYEGMSGVTLEALASGTPFLGSDVIGINDVVPDQRFLFEVGNEHDLSRKIKQIMKSNDLREQMKIDAMEFVKKFVVTITIDKHIDLYGKLIALRKPR